MMKKILLLMVVVGAMALSSCGPKMYSTQSGGKDDVSYVIVVTEGPRYEHVSVVIDGTSHAYDRVEKIKNKRKAERIVVEPGKHNIKVVVNRSVVSEEDVFLSVQETKTIRLR